MITVFNTAKILSINVWKIKRGFYYSVLFVQVKYEWIEDLLPRLHELDAYGLSGCLAPSIEETINATSEDNTQNADTKIGKHFC